MTHLLALWAALAWAGCGEVCEKDARPACRACVLEAAKAGEEPPAEAVLQTSLRGMDKPELSVLLKLHRDKASEIEKETREDAPAARQAAIAALERRLEELDAAEEPGDLSDEAYCGMYPKSCILDDDEKAAPRPESLVRADRKARAERAAREGACLGKHVKPCIDRCPSLYDFANKLPGKRRRAKLDPACEKACRDQSKEACDAEKSQ